MTWCTARAVGSGHRPRVTADRTVDSAAEFWRSAQVNRGTHLVRPSVWAMAAAVLVVSCGSAAPQVQPSAPPASTATEATRTGALDESSTSTLAGDVRWVAITGVSARVDAPTVLHVDYDVCAQVPPPRVIESANEVRLTIDFQHDYAGFQLACGTIATIQLAEPIGDRKVIDDHYGTAFTVVLQDPPPKPATPTGGVHDVLGQEGYATVTAWLLIDKTGAGKLCDNLPATASSCPTPTLAVDWKTSGAAPPTDLVQRGTVRVSTGPITLRGSLKIDILFVGIVP